MFRPLYLEPLEDRSLPSVFVHGDVRGVSVFVDHEPSNSTLANAAYAPPPGAPSPHSSKEAAIFYALEMGTEIHVYDMPDAYVVAYWRFEIDTLCSVANSLGSGARESNVENGPSMTPTLGPRETSGAANLDRSSMGSETAGKPSLSAVASLDPVASFGDHSLSNGMAEVFGSGSLANGLLLDGWQYGLPAPQADLVPAGDKDLTAIAAYLVNSPAPAPVVQPPTEIMPASGIERGPTDFIVGFQPQLSGRTADGPVNSSQPPPAHDLTPAMPEGSFPVPSVSHPAPVDPENGVMPSVGKSGPAEPLPEVDDLPPSAPESGEMPEEAGDSE